MCFQAQSITSAAEAAWILRPLGNGSRTLSKQNQNEFSEACEVVPYPGQWSRAFPRQSMRPALNRAAQVIYYWQPRWELEPTTGCAPALLPWLRLNGGRQNRLRRRTALHDCRVGSGGKMDRKPCRSILQRQICSHVMPSAQVQAEAGAGSQGHKKKMPWT